MKSVYIHIPFCKSKCLYCDFNSYDNKQNLINEYFKALKIEIEKYSFDSKLDTIYIGGGTPSFVDQQYIVDVIKMLPNADEITIEANPGTVSEEKLLAYKSVNINRISMGLQSTQNDILKNIGRIHTVQDFEKSFTLMRSCGFENINVDLMHGLPNQTYDNFKDSVDYLVELNPEHISCYSLIVHNNIFRNLPTDEEERKMYYYAKSKLKENGYIHYEISNFSKDQRESQHNLVYWNQGEYIGFGAGASSYENNVRFSNISNIDEYIKRVNSNEDIRIIEEIQDKTSKKKEFIILQLRLIKGLNIEEINEKFNIDFLKEYENTINKLLKMDLIEIDKYMKLTEKGLDLANIVWEEFI